MSDTPIGPAATGAGVAVCGCGVGATVGAALTGAAAVAVTAGVVAAAAVAAAVVAAADSGAVVCSWLGDAAIVGMLGAADDWFAVDVAAAAVTDRLFDGGGPPAEAVEHAITSVASPATQIRVNGEDPEVGVMFRAPPRWHARRQA